MYSSAVRNAPRRRAYRLRGRTITFHSIVLRRRQRRKIAHTSRLAINGLPSGGPDEHPTTDHASVTERHTLF